MGERRTACIFLNGDPPNKKIIDAVIADSSFVVCADGAANYLKKMRITPNIIIGDLDSITPPTAAFYKTKIPILKNPDQETTDFEKCLIYCQKNNYTTIAVLGFSSAHADHTLGNYSTLKRYYRRLSVTLVDNIFYISFIPGQTSFSYKTKEIISLLALPTASGITTTGLQYPLRNETLAFGARDGTRNTAVRPRVTIKFKSGHLLLFKKHFII